MQFAFGALLAAAVALAALRASALTRSGTVAAFIVGAAVFGAGGWPAAAVMFAFFAPSIALSRLGKARKRELLDIGKTGARDGWQVLANGGVAALALILSLRFGASYAAAFAGALAAASADTWGTEIGTLARGLPRSILTFRRLETGLSGGITVQGTLAEVAGAGCVALVAYLAHLAPFFPVALAGMAGAFVDSLLGASAQALRWCPQCERAAETNPHHCGTATSMRRGVSWMENDAVNVVATLSGALVALLLSRA
ncbi:MAG TPA: DUF92 domain-containing protein [Candidatus Baltobacteraceae bacterium]|jgi:uncharacterized protein (TIGR00297 family)|nr:DUF92 domain-containing protein [Candidatus Baltobacteraceae bacterium]